MLRIKMVATLILLGSFAWSQTAEQLSLEVKEFVSVDSPVVALLNVQVIDGTGVAPKLNQTILIDKGRIAAVGSDVDIPNNAKRLELSNHTVLPGFVGVHNHTFYTTSVRTA